MTTSELARDIGREANFYIAGTNLSVRVRIMDTKVAWGEIRYLVVPLAGAGNAWVTALKLRFGED